MDPSPPAYPATADRLRSLLTADLYDFDVGTDLVVYRYCDGRVRRLMATAAACGITSYDEVRTEADFLEWEDAFARLESMAGEFGKTLGEQVG